MKIFKNFNVNIENMTYWDNFRDEDIDCSSIPEYTDDQILLERKRKLVRATVGVPIGISFLAAFFMLIIIDIIYLINKINDKSFSFLDGVNKLREIEPSQYGFAIVALAALQATIFIGAQNRAHSKDLPLGLSILSASFNSFSKIFSFLTAMLLMIITIISFGDFTAYICIFLFWTSASICGLFSDDLAVVRKNLTTLEFDKKYYEGEKDNKNISDGSLERVWKYVKEKINSFCESHEFSAYKMIFSLVFWRKNTLIQFFLYVTLGMIFRYLNDYEMPKWLFLVIATFVVYLLGSAFTLILYLSLMSLGEKSKFELIIFKFSYYVIPVFTLINLPFNYIIITFAIVNIIFSIFRMRSFVKSEVGEKILNKFYLMRLEETERAININRKIENLNSIK